MLLCCFLCLLQVCVCFVSSTSQGLLLVFPGHLHTVISTELCRLNSTNNLKSLMLGKGFVVLSFNVPVNSYGHLVTCQLT